MGSQSNYRSAQVALAAEAATRLLVFASGTLFYHQWSWIKPTNQAGPGRLSVDFGPPRCPVADSWCASPASTHLKTRHRSISAQRSPGLIGPPYVG